MKIVPVSSKSIYFHSNAKTLDQNENNGTRKNISQPQFANKIQQTLPNVNMTERNQNVESAFKCSECCTQKPPRRDKVLILDDNEINLMILKNILTTSNYEVISLTDPKKAQEAILAFEPDLILSDISMPELDGFELCKILKADKKIRDIPLIFISALNESDNIIKGFECGAVDYVTKPFKVQEIEARIKTHLQIKKLQNELESSNKLLEQKVNEQVKKISATQMVTIFSLAKLAQSRDDSTGLHLERVQKYCRTLAEKLRENPLFKDEIDDKFIENLTNASPLHDIGKVGISDAILLKPGKLTEEEFAIMQKHTSIGAKTLEEVSSKFGGNAFIEMGTVIARSHHERYDGKGYPDKLAGKNIPLAARIMTIADVYDALGTKRTYKEPFPQEKCVEIIKNGRGTQFDPDIVDCFLEISDEFYNIRKEYED